MKAACATGSSKLPLLEPLRCGSFGIPQIVARNSDPVGVFVPMSTMVWTPSDRTLGFGEHGLACNGSNPLGARYLIGAASPSPGKTSWSISTQMECSSKSTNWGRLSLSDTPFEFLSISSTRDVHPGELVVN
jgi:hypothetical protein